MILQNKQSFSNSVMVKTPFLMKRKFSLAYVHAIINMYLIAVERKK